MQAKALLVIAVVLNGFGPRGTVQNPLYCTSQAAFESFWGLPVQDIGHFSGVNGIALVMAFTVFDERDELLAWADFSVGGASSSSVAHSVFTSSILVTSFWPPVLYRSPVWPYSNARIKAFA